MSDSDNDGSGKYDANPRTKALRPKSGLTKPEENRVRKLRKTGLSAIEISEMIKVSPDKVDIVLSNLRTSVEEHDRRTLNVSEEAYNKIMKMSLPGETVRQTVDRVLNKIVL